MKEKKFLHDKSGGVVLDILLLILLFITCTTAFINMTALYFLYYINDSNYFKSYKLLCIYEVILTKVYWIKARIIIHLP